MDTVGGPRTSRSAVRGSLRDSFVVEGWAAWASFGFTFAGWLLAPIVVAGLPGGVQAGLS